MPLRILHIITRLIIGGAQENTFLSVLGQRERGAKVRLIAGPTVGPEGTLVPQIHAAGIDYVEIPSLHRAIEPFSDLFAYRALRKAIQEYRPDVVHTHSSKAGILGRAAAWKEHVPRIVHTIHGLPFHPYQSVLLRHLYIAAERWAAKRCHRLISVADAMTEQAVAAAVAPREKFVTVYSGMEIEPFLSPPSNLTEVRHRYGLNPTDVVIGKIARLFELKGHDDLLPVFARLVKTHETEAREALPRVGEGILWPLPPSRRLRLFLVGDGIWRKRLENLAQELGIRDRVVFAGLLPPSEIPHAIHAMDLVVHCSLREGLARVLPQALLARKPVISYDIDGAREVVQDRVTGRLVPPRDQEALFHAIRETLANFDLACQMAEEGCRRCRMRFDWRTMVDTLMAIYQSLPPSPPTEASF